MATRKKSTPAGSATLSATAGQAVGEEAGQAADAAGREPADAVSTVKHRAKRKNIPPSGLEAQGRVEEAPKVRLDYNPHLPPRLRFSDDPAAADRLPELLATARQRALTEDEARTLAEALRKHEPWLEWAGKRERPWTEVEPPALHIHERVSTQAMLRVLTRDDVQKSLFADPQQSYAEAVQFYRHDVDWANRMILGDSLAVMASLARREDLAGKVQMIYIDPPYGISFKSNFQPQLGQRDVKDKVQDLTREPEMVKAYRDTWTLGVHSYLAYLRDRLAMAKELLTDSGSVFVQISDENLHRVRAVMDEVFGTAQYVLSIVVKKKSATTQTDPVCDYLLWYGKDRSKLRLNQLFAKKSSPEDDSKFNTLISFAGEMTRVASLPATSISRLLERGDRWARVNYPLVSQDASERSQPYLYRGRPFSCGANRHWTYDPIADMPRLEAAERIFDGGGESLGAVVIWDDWPMTSLNNLWSDLHGEPSPIYVVQTSYKVIERCVLMTTDPGDLVLDPTCGSGTTAFVAEKWGRRWITCDTSRVALALAKQRLMTATFEHFKLRALNPEDLLRNPRGAWLRNGGAEPRTFHCRTVPHITLKSIARNTALDPIFAKHEPALADALARLNQALARVKPALKDALATKHREEGASAVTDADQRRWLLPDTPTGAIKEAKAAKPLKALTAKQAAAYRAAIPAAEWKPWQAPFDTDPDWPAELQAALRTYRQAWRAKMDEVNACIEANAEMEELVDQPLPEPGVVRVAGPFTMEGVIAREMGPDDDSPIGGAPEALDAFAAADGLGADAAAESAALASRNAEAHLDKILRLLKAAGVDFAGNKNLRFDRLEPVTGSGLIHAEGTWVGSADGRVAVSIGPEVGHITAWQVEDAMRSANRAGYDELVFAGFGFDAAAQAAIDEGGHARLRLHMALIRPDVAMGELLKAQPGSQLFTVFSAPRVLPPRRLADGQWQIEVEGMDVYDPVGGALHPTSRERIAAWFVDTDYDSRSFCICQAFFPDRRKWDKLARALGDKGVVDEGRFDELTGFVTLPFARPPAVPPGRPWRVAVKVIDPRGNEGLRVVTMPDPR
jgi:adenine-specific DNA-methyltransferase